MSAGFLLLAGFVWWERRQRAPLLDLSLFRKNPVFLFSNIAAMINYAVVFAVSFLLSLYLQYIRGFDPQTAGIILVSMPVVQMVVAPLAGNLSDRIDAQVIATAGMACTTAGLGVMALLSPATSLVIILAGLFLLGLGYGLFSSPNTNAIMSAVRVQHLGVASAMVSTMRSIGQMVSMAIAMLVFSIVMGTVQITPEVYPGLLQSITVVFTIFFFLGLVGIWTSYARGETRVAG
jgi:MFS family permease